MVRHTSANPLGAGVLLCEGQTCANAHANFGRLKSDMLAQAQTGLEK